MPSKEEIGKLTGLRGIELNHLIEQLERRGVDWAEVIDWKTLGEEIKDRGNKYEAAWEWLYTHYGFTPPQDVLTHIKEKEKRFEEAEEEWLLSSKEGVKEALRRIYEGELSLSEERKLREKLREIAPSWIATIAVWDGVEREYAKKFLAEEIISATEKEAVEIIKGKNRFTAITSRGKVVSIDGIPVKEMDVESFVKLVEEEGFKPVSSVSTKEGTETVFAKEEIEKKPKEEEIIVTEDMLDKMIKMEGEKGVVEEEDIAKLLEEKERLIRQRNEEIKRWIVTQLEGYDPYVRIGVDIADNKITIKAWYEGTSQLKSLPSRFAPYVREVLTPFFATGDVEEAEKLKKQVLDKIKKVHHMLISMGISAAGYLIERVKKERKLYMCDICGYTCSEERAEELNYLCPRCNVPLTAIG